MAFNIVVPPLSESVVDATIGEWLKKVGDPVKAGDVLVVLETDKVNLEVTADGDGILQSIAHGVGADVKAGEILGVIDGVASVAPSAPVSVPDGPPSNPAPSAGETRATPVAKRVAEANAVDIAQVPAGDGSRVKKADVENFVAKQAPAPAPSAPVAKPVPSMPSVPSVPSAPASTGGLSIFETNPREERVKMTRRRRTIAQNLLNAKQSTAMLTTFNEIDMSRVMEVRARRKESFQKKYGVGLGFSSFFVKASIGALKAFPLLNAEIDGDHIIKKHYYDIGMAIGAEEGLVVPVLRDADRMSFAEIELKIKEYAEQARNGTLSFEALVGGTFTITNGGVFGSLMSTPIVNHPQVAILGLHAIKDRPVVVNGEIVVRPMMYVAMSYDHRIVDGREAVQFLVTIKNLMEDPESLLIEG